MQSFQVPTSANRASDRAGLTPAARVVECLLALDAAGALREAQQARTEAARLRAFLREAATVGADPEAILARAAGLLSVIEPEE